MNLLEFTSALPKPWLDINANSINADSLVVASLEADSLTLLEQVGVPNPAAGFSTSFMNLAGDLSVTNSAGNVVVLLQDDGSVPMTAAFDSNGFQTVRSAGTQYNHVATPAAPPAAHTVLYVTGPGKVATESSAAVVTTLLEDRGGVPMLAAFDMNNNEIKNVSAVRPIATNILIGRTATTGGNSLANNVVIGELASTTTTAGSIVVIGGSATSSSGAAVVIGTSASNLGQFNVIVGELASMSAAQDNSVIVGRSATSSVGSVVIVGGGSSSTGFGSVIVGSGSSSSGGDSTVIGRTVVSSAAAAHAFGDNITNATANSVLLGNAAVVNVRPASAVCDLGTVALPWQNAYLSSGLDAGGATALSIGATNATSVAIGRATVLSTINGIAAATVANAAWYCTTPFSPAFVIATPMLTPPAASSSGLLSEFTQLLGVLTYTGTRTRTFRVEYNITIDLGSNGSNMTWFNSKNASVVISATQTAPDYEVTATNAGRVTCISFSDNISLATGDTVQLGGSCAANEVAAAYNKVSCNVIALLD